MLLRVCRAGSSPALTNFLKTGIVSKPFTPRIQSSRLFSRGRNESARTVRKSTTFLERAMAPAKDTAYNIGKCAVAGGAVVGLGALGYYGLGLSTSTGVIDYAKIWPQYVRDRVKTTYMYVGASIALTATSAVLCLRSPTVMNMVMSNSKLAFFGTMAAAIGSLMVVQNIPYKEGFGAKQIAWLVHNGVLGAILAPLYFVGGPLVLTAAWYTAGIVGGLSTIAVCAPSEKFLTMGGSLAIGLGVVFASSVGSMFLPPTTALGSGLHSMNVYGGLLLFSLYLLYNTQRIIKQAETHPQYIGNMRPYDPINQAISLQLDVLNIFVRIHNILLGRGSSRQK